MSTLCNIFHSWFEAISKGFCLNYTFLITLPTCNSLKDGCFQANLPFNIFAGVAGSDPTTWALTAPCSTNWAILPLFGDPAGARTRGPSIKSAVLYQLSYEVFPLCFHQDSNLDSLIKSQEVSPLTYESILKVFRKSYNRIGGIISPNIRSTTLTLTGQAVCLNFHLTRFWPLNLVPIEGIEPPYPNTWARLTILNVANIRCKQAL